MIIEKTHFQEKLFQIFYNKIEIISQNLEEFANKVFDKIQKNNRTRYIALCEYLDSEYSIKVKDVIPDENKPFSKIFNKSKKELLLSDYSSLETKKLTCCCTNCTRGC